MRKKIIIAIILNVLIISATLGIISYLSVRESIERSLRNRLALARTISNYVEVFLYNNFSRLHDVSLSGNITLKDKNWGHEKKMLETVYRYSLFTEGVFLLDKHGNEVQTYPANISYLSNLTYIGYVNDVLIYGKPVISNVYTIEPIKKQVVFMMTPLRDGEGRVAGVVGGILGLTDRFLSQLLQSAQIDNSIYIEIIDSNDVVVASADPSHMLQPHKHGGALSDMIMKGEAGIVTAEHISSSAGPAEEGMDRLAFVPLSIAKWGVVVGQSESDLLAPAINLKRKFLLIVFIFVGTSIVFAFGMTMNIVKPLRSLISSTDKIASGDLSTPVGDLGSDEILRLSKSFDDMRKKLAISLESVKNQNIELEHRVARRTQEIRKSRQKIEHLLKKIISSQEEERKRIARGLHDTILQDILAFLIKLDICKLRVDLVTTEKIDEMRNIAMKAVDNAHSVIADLRPSILDDLGIVSAVEWLAEKHLREKGINVFMDVQSSPIRRLSAEAEITLFRIVQESIINIERHANAGNVIIVFVTRDHYLSISVEDDGKGFDADQLLKHPMEDGRGLGLMGMKERASLLDGVCRINSRAGKGTRMSVEIQMKDITEYV